MSNILLFFMSSYTPTVENGAYNRAQTNEAVLYELQKKKESRTDMVLALCSDKVRKDPCVPTLDGGAPTTTLTYFRQHVLPAANIRDDHFFPIPVPDSMNEDSQAKAIQDIVKNVNTGDTLYIDLSGGMRDTAMLLVAVARYLRDLRDVNRTRRLSSYLSRSDVRSPKTAILLNCIEKFSNDLLLCNASRLLDDISDLKNALADVLKGTNAAHDTLDTLLYKLLNGAGTMVCSSRRLPC